MIKKLLIFGNTDAATQMFYHFSGDSIYEVIGFTVDEPYIRTRENLGLPVWPFAGIELRFPPEDHLIFVAIGYSGLNRLRAEKYAEAKAKGYTLASFISPKAHISRGCIIGDNCVVGANCALQPLVKVGSNVVIRENVFVGSGTEINDHCYISGAAAIAGGVTIGPGSFIGINAVARRRIPGGLH